MSKAGERLLRSVRNARRAFHDRSIRRGRYWYAPKRLLSLKIALFNRRIAKARTEWAFDKEWRRFL